MTVEQLAERAKVTSSYIRRLIRQRSIKAEQIGRRVYLIPTQEAERFLRTPRPLPGRPKKIA